MDNTKTNKIIEVLESIKDRPNMYFGESASLDTVISFINGMHVALSTIGYRQDHTTIKQVTEKHGFEFMAKSPAHEMQESGMGLSEIINKILDLEIDIWRNTLKTNQL